MTKRPEREEIENGVVVGWWSTTFNSNGERVAVFIPRRCEDIQADLRERAS